MVIRLTSFLRAVAALLLAFCSVCAAEVTASLSPASVPAGEAATLSLKIEGGEVQDLKLPQVPDVIMQGPVQNFSSSSNINGVVRQSLSLSYAVGSMKAGEYTIPPITVIMDGVEHKTQPFTLKVTPSANQQPQGFFRVQHRVVVEVSHALQKVIALACG